MEKHPPRLAHVLDGRHGLLIAAQVGKLSEKRRRSAASYVREKLRTDPQFRALRNARRRFKIALKAQTQKPCLRLIGYTPAQFRAHIEGLFLPGMTWGNYGKWEIDHVRPCRTFDLRDDEARRVCFALSNLQPLWKPDNRRKSGSYLNLGDGIRLTVDGKRMLR